MLRGERLFQNCTFIKGVEKLQSECKKVNDSKTPITWSEILQTSTRLHKTEPIN